MWQTGQVVESGRGYSGKTKTELMSRNLQSNVVSTLCRQIFEAAGEHRWRLSTMRGNCAFTRVCTTRERASFGSWPRQDSESCCRNCWGDEQENHAAWDETQRRVCRQVVTPGKGVSLLLLQLLCCTLNTLCRCIILLVRVRVTYFACIWSAG